MKKPKANKRHSSKKTRSIPTQAPKRGDAYQHAVALVAKSLVPSAEVEVGVWTKGPDGRRDLDVVVREKDGGSVPLVVIECKDWNKPIGIAFVDALDSKRRDIGASIAMICSNSGFTADAFRKAARVGIPAISALIEGDSKIRVVVREQIYTRVVKLVHNEPLFHHQKLTDQMVGAVAGARTVEVTYNGKSLESWIAVKLLEIAAIATHSRTFLAKFTFRDPIKFNLRGIDLFVTGIDIGAAFTVQWNTQVVEIGASQGMYSHLRKVVVSGPGAFQFHLKNVDSQNWGVPVAVEDVPPRLLLPIDQRPDPHPGMPSMEMSLAMVENLPDPKDPPDIDQFVLTKTVMDSASLG